MKKRIKRIIWSVVILLLLVIIILKMMKSDEETFIDVKYTEVVTGDVVKTVTATGTLQPITQVEVGTQVSGVVEKVYVDYNSVVKKGQLIAELDKTNLRSTLTQTQSQYDNAVNDRDYLKGIYLRQKSLFDQNLIAQTDYDLALYNYKNAEGIVSQRYADLERARTNLGYADIYSPIDGVVLSCDIEAGQTVAASLNTPTLFTIAQDLTEMQVEADVDEADIGQVLEGQRVTFTVDAYQGELFEGAVSQVRLNPTTTSNVVTYTVVVKATNKELKLKPGMTATITIITNEQKQVKMLEAKAVNFSMDEELLGRYYQQIGKQTPVLKLKSGSKTEKVVYLVKNKEIEERKIKVGISDGVNVQIIEGLNEGEKVLYDLKEETVSDIESTGEGSPFLPSPPGRKK